jgi:hypothetical protein
MFTMQNPKNIAGCVKTLAAAFKGFRKTRFWKDRVKGGFVGYEITHNGNGAHVHLHTLVDCRWLAVATPEPTRRHTAKEKARLCELAQAELSAAWAGYLGQSKAIVWVRRADRDALAETIKYPFKPADFLKLKCRLSDIIDEIDAGRRVASFGHCHAASKLFLGREQKAPVEKLCRKCKVDRSIYPVEAITRWERGISAPTKRAAVVMDLVYVEGLGVKRLDNTYIDADGQRRHDETGDAIPW